MIVIAKENTGCHIWMGCMGADGYGTHCLNGKQEYAHHVAFMIEHDREPEGFIHQTCGNKLCVNPAHLREESK